MEGVEGAENAEGNEGSAKDSLGRDDSGSE